MDYLGKIVAIAFVLILIIWFAFRGSANEGELLMKSYFSYLKDRDMQSILALYNADYIRKFGSADPLSAIHETHYQLGRPISHKLMQSKIIRPENQNNAVPTYYLTYDISYNATRQTEVFILQQKAINKDIEIINHYTA